MAEPTLVQMFGAGASQTSNNLTLAKADFLSVGLTASANNSSESLLLAILKRARLNQDTSVSTQLSISEPVISVVQRSGVNLTRYRYSIDIFVPDSNPVEPNPEDI